MMKYRNMFIDDLPRKGKTSQIDGLKCIGYKVKFIFDDIEGEVEIVDYKDGYFYIKYLDKPVYKILSDGFKKCRLSILLNKKSDEFKYGIGQVFKDNKRDLTIIDRKVIVKERIYKNRKNKSNTQVKWYKYKCNICGFECGEHYKNQEYKEEYWIEESNLTTGNGCSCCTNQIVVKGYNDVPTTAPFIIPYFQGGYDEAKMYNYKSNHKIYPKCPDCGRVKDKPTTVCNIITSGSIRCACGDGISYPEKLMIAVLEQLEVNFITEYSPEWCKYISFNNISKIKTGRYDFKLNDYPYIIEMDGAWHSKDNKMSGTKKEESEYIDFIKDKLAKENGYEVIRIDCNYISDRFKYIKNNLLKSNLSELFDLSIIDWSNAEHFALTNLAKKSCDLWNSGIHSTKEISKILKIKYFGTIIGYLKKGNELGLCNYNPAEEMRKSLAKGCISNRKPVQILKDGILLGVFESVKDLEDKSELTFGVKLNALCMRSVCSNHTKQHKGFTFKYINKEIDKYETSYGNN